MGRSPSFAEHVRPIRPKETIRELDDLFCYFFAVGEVVAYEDGTQAATIDGSVDNLYVRFIQSEYSMLPVLERSCSIYRKIDDHFPEKENIYRIVSAIRYRFKNKHSLGETFFYDVLELQNIKDEYYTTFCIKTDGSVLNIESLSVRGSVRQVMVAPSIRQLKA